MQIGFRFPSKVEITEGNSRHDTNSEHDLASVERKVFVNLREKSRLLSLGNVCANPGWGRIQKIARIFAKHRKCYEFCDNAWITRDEIYQKPRCFPPTHESVLNGTNIYCLIVIPTTTNSTFPDFHPFSAFHSPKPFVTNLTRFGIKSTARRQASTQNRVIWLIIKCSRHIRVNLRTWRRDGNEETRSLLN